VRLFEVFGQIAIVLCAVGIYAIAAFSASARQRELAIRAAFGASRRDLVAVLLREEMRPVLIGAASGMLVAFVTMPRLGSLLFGLSPVDPLTYVLVTIVVIALGAGACYLPARRAGAADPAELLRA
jgi:putative ABC transport system permease protein